MTHLFSSSQKISLQHNSRAGFGVILYVLLAIVMLATITGAIAVSSNQGNDNARTTGAGSELITQTNYIASAIRDCFINFGTSDTGDEQNQGYPGSSTAGGVSNAAANTLNCPGSGQDIFGTDWFYPRDINFLGDWQYSSNGTDGVYISITLTDNTNVFRKNITGHAAIQFSAGEAVTCAGSTMRAAGDANPGERFVYFIKKNDAAANPCD